MEEKGYFCNKYVKFIDYLHQKSEKALVSMSFLKILNWPYKEKFRISEFLRFLLSLSKLFGSVFESIKSLVLA